MGWSKKIIAKYIAGIIIAWMNDKFKITNVSFRFIYELCNWNNQLTERFLFEIYHWLTQRGTFLTIMQLKFNYFTIIAAVVKKICQIFFKNLRTLILFPATFDNTIHGLLPYFPWIEFETIIRIFTSHQFKVWLT